MRFDLRTIASWISPESRVLDLGCGAGELMKFLQEEKGVKGTGIEIDEDKVAEGIISGITIIHGDIYEEIQDFQDSSFDYVIMSQTLQQVLKPVMLLKEMLRVGKTGIVSFPNFSHYKNRLYLFFKGRAPISRELPYEWFDTPNIRVIPLKDFQRFCRQFGFLVLKEIAISTHHHDEKGREVKCFPNLFATYGIYMLAKKEKTDKAL